MNWNCLCRPAKPWGGAGPDRLQTDTGGGFSAMVIYSWPGVMPDNGNNDDNGTGCYRVWRSPSRLFAQFDQDGHAYHLGAERRGFAYIEMLDAEADYALATLVFDPRTIGQAGPEYASG
jgi:hypothetical protein